MTQDGSQLAASWSDGKFVVRKPFKLELDTTKIIGVWLANSPVTRYAPPSEFESGKPVLVFPGCRVLADDLKIDNDSVSWKNDSKSIVGEVIVDQREQRGAQDDVRPKYHQVKTSQHRMVPTIWFEPANVKNSDAGIITLKTGEKIVVSKSNGLAIQSVDQNTLSLSNGSKLVNIPMENVQSIRFSRQ